jgi:hypothetical protein
VGALSAPADETNPARTRREDFGAVMPFTTVTLPEHNIYGLAPGPLSFGGFGYAALIKPLKRGTHTIDFHPEGEGAPPDSHAVITVG